MATFEAINQYLTCKLCGNYYDEAYTLPECLHTFCKACITGNFEKQASGLKMCPEPSCGEQVGRDPDKQPKYDRCLQDCVNQLIPRAHEDLNKGKSGDASIGGNGSSTSASSSGNNNNKTKRRRIGDGEMVGDDMDIADAGSPESEEEDCDEVIHSLTVLVCLFPRERAVRVGEKNMNLKKVTIRAYLYTQVRELRAKIKSVFGVRADTFDCELCDREGVVLHNDVPLLSLAFMAGFVGHHNETNSAVVNGKDLILHVEYALR
jgi:hypothetical protein